MLRHQLNRVPTQDCAAGAELPGRGTPKVRGTLACYCMPSETLPAIFVFQQAGALGEHSVFELRAPIPTELVNLAKPQRVPLKLRQSLSVTPRR